MYFFILLFFLFFCVFFDIVWFVEVWVCPTKRLVYSPLRRGSANRGTLAGGQNEPLLTLEVYTVDLQAGQGMLVCPPTWIDMNVLL